MRSTIPKLHVFFIPVLLIAILAGCGDDSTGPDFSSEFDVQLISTSSHGEVLADGEGNVLYFFTPDAEGESRCEGDCIANWPIFYAEQLQTANALNADNFGTITRPDGSSQTTYKGWPLYYYAGDGQPGTVNGDGLNDVWYVAKAGYTVMLASQQLVGQDGNNYRVDDSGNYIEGEGTITHFVDARGRTLYIFVNDSANTNNFTAEDFSNNGAWPIFEEELNAVPSGLDASLFGSIDVYGRQQLTYKGWPLYYFGQDEMQRGNTRGVSVPEPGIWPVARKEMASAPGYSPAGSNGDDPNPNY